MPEPPVIICTGCSHCIATNSEARRLLLEELAATRRERSTWSAFGSAAGTAIVITLWQVFSLLTQGHP